ncbi:hypothetical protein [Neptunomonas marina]|uniref:Uncharacterized protein n=1 Tax=Neptunomonas marina TaxID=1815562 RepID=A0A437Q6C4_9GAMM|nr:hypothetical protein [Neptunomonas marina]RVU30037.1 hypothetical protein EOE65_13340 [Neptunomonas marina]
MKTYLQRLLCCGLLILTAPFVHAVNVSSNDRGEVLLFPLYTAQNGWDTYLNLFTQGGLVHIKFRSAQTGEVLDSFHIYGGAASTFRASLSTIAPGKTVMRVAEGQCVIGGQVGSEVLHQGGVGTDLPLSADIGFIEVFATGLAMNGMQPEYGRTGFSCAEYAANWATNGRWQTHPDADMDAAGYTAQIRGNVNLVSVTKGLSAVSTAVALAETGIQFSHQHPTKNQINLTQTVGGIQAVADALNVTGISNFVDSNDFTAADTQWVVTYPLAGYGYTKPYVRDVETSCGIAHNSNISSVTAELAHHTDVFVTNFTSVLNQSHSVSHGFCNAVNLYAPVGQVSSYNSLSDSSSLITEGFSFSRTEVGLLKLSFIQSQQNFGNGKTVGEIKHPVLGFRLTTYVNGTLFGGKVLSNYMFLDAHRPICNDKENMSCGS